VIERDVFCMLLSYFKIVVKRLKLAILIEVLSNVTIDTSLMIDVV
jgi:hypothetical protein